MIVNKRFRFGITYFVIIAILLVGGIESGSSASVDPTADKILQDTGVKGGLIVHLGCNDGKLTAAFHKNDSYLIHGIDSDSRNVKKARDYFQSLGLYGSVTADYLAGNRLPYADNMVNLLVAENMGNISKTEIMRVLAPNGVAYIRQGETWTKSIKPRPEEMDEWTHFLYDASNNAVSHDTAVGYPNFMRWIGEPKTARSHDHLASMSAAVSAGGRIYYIADEGPTAALALPPQWMMIARDAYNGVLLWKKEIGPWEGHLRGFRSGPPELHRRLIAIDDRIYATLGYGEPLTLLDGATGECIKTYEGTDGTLEILYSDGVLYLVTGEMDISELKKRRSASPPPRQKKLLAIQAETGDLLWQKADKDTNEIMPLTLAIAEGCAYFQNPDNILCLDAKTGDVQWCTSRPLVKQRWGWSTPTLVVHDGVVLSADRKGPEPSEVDQRPEQIEWNPSSRGGEAPSGELIAYSAKTGEELWRCPCQETYNAPTDVLIVDDLVWTGKLVRSKQPGITNARDVKTGEVKRERPPDHEFYTFGFGHHRCYRNKATDEYLLMGRSGVEYLDVDTGNVIANHWIRGTCQYGIMPSNGLLYVPPHSCACFIEAKLNGFIALSSQQSGRNAMSVPVKGERLEKGPAFGKIDNESDTQANDNESWPTYRHDPGRSGKIKTSMPAKVKNGWERELGGKLTPPTAADGKIFTAAIDSHQVYALDAENGSVLWSYTAGGRVDSPPTFWQERILFGSADGYVYCLRASDGKLAWRFRAAPVDQRIVAYGQLESVWPVPGNVLVVEEDSGASAYVVAGRSSYIDGGLYLYKLNPETGEMLSQKCINHRDPQTGLPPQDTAHGVNIPGALPDVLSSDGEYVYMRHTRFDKNGEKLEPNVPHLFSPAGFMDDSWWHRTYWVFGTDMQSGWGSWPNIGNTKPAGRLLVVDDSTIYAFGRLGQYATHGSHVGLQDPLLPWPPPESDSRGRGTTHYRLFATDKEPEVITLTTEQRRRGREQKQVACKWSQPMNIVVRAMVLADDTLFVAGPPELLTLPDRTQDLEAAQAAYKGQKGAVLQAISTENGETVAEYNLDSTPVLDGMIAADGKWFVSTMDGKLICLKGE